MSLMSPCHKEIFDVELRSMFIRDLHLDEEFFAIMRKDNCITDDIMEKVQIKLKLYGSQEGISEFLTSLKMRPERAFKQFVRALIETSQGHLAALIDRELEKRGEQPITPDIRNRPIGNIGRYDTVDAAALEKEVTEFVEDTVKALSSLKITPMSAEKKKSLFNFQSCYRPLVSAQQTGRVIILNNKEVDGNTDRKGSEFDELNLEELFKQFNFEVVIEINKSAKEMMEILNRESRREDLVNIDILIVILMSHGRSNVVLGKDGEPVTIQPDVTSVFSNENCPDMAGKPKLFIIQACQNEKGGPVSVPDLQNPDMYVAMAAVAGDSAFRIRAAGSWYIRAIICVIAKCSHIMDLIEMIALASDAVRNLKTPKDEIQLPKAVSTLDKECYLIHSARV